MSGPVVGIIANPVSARDIRRIISHAGSLQITDRANIVLRILAGLAATGVGRAVMMPENAGIRGHLTRAMTRAANLGEARFPALSFLDMPVTAKEALRIGGFDQLPLTADHAARLETLPWHHRDPFDRMLIAQAQHEGYVLVTADGRCREYDVAVL